MNLLENKVKETFANIKADERLKEDTYQYLQEKLQPKEKIPYKRFIVAAVAFVLILVAGLFSYTQYTTEAAYLDIDANPSIELTLNKFDRVIGVYAYNEEGKEIIEKVDLKNKSYQDALKLLVDELFAQGYVSDSDLFTATLQSKNKQTEQAQLDDLRAYIESLFAAKKAATTQEIFTVDAKTKSHAHDENLTPAKYLAILQLQAEDPTVTIDSCRDHTIGEIKRQTHEHQNQHNTNDTGASDSTSTSSHHEEASLQGHEIEANHEAEHEAEAVHGEAETNHEPEPEHAVEENHEPEGYQAPATNHEPETNHAPATNDHSGGHGSHND